MAWDTTKVANDDILSADWNEMVSYIKTVPSSFNVTTTTTGSSTASVSGNLTPTNISQRVLLTGNTTLSINNSSISGEVVYIKIYRGTTSGTLLATQSIKDIFGSDTVNLSVSFLDFPASTSQVTYTVLVGVSNTGYTLDANTTTFSGVLI